MTRILIIGATSSIAEHTARLWGNKDTEFVLVARSKSKLEAISADLAVRTGAKVEQILIDFTNPKEISAVMTRVFKKPIDSALIAHGVLTRQEDVKNITVIRDSVLINAASHAMFAEEIAGHFENQGHGKLGIIGSIAGERGRAELYIYGASKAFLEKLVDGLNSRFVGTAIKVSIIKPGPVATPMISGDRAAAKFTAKPETVAKLIVRGMAKGQAKIYTPRIWRLIAIIIRMMPAAIYNRVRV